MSSSCARAHTFHAYIKFVAKTCEALSINTYPFELTGDDEVYKYFCSNC